MSRGSFRDPAGRVVLERDRVLRFVEPAAGEFLAAFLESPSTARLIESGLLIASRRVSADDRSVAFEHERVPFASYPFEWPAVMLHAAAALTLDLAEQLLDRELELKDATPFNVLFRGSRPVFVDLSSIRPRHPADPIWIAAAQFERTFVLPLLACRDSLLDPPMIFLTKRDGLEPEHLYRSATLMQKIRPRFLWTVTLPALLGRRLPADEQKIYRPARAKSPEAARFAVAMTFRRLRRELASVAPPRVDSPWTRYGVEPESYGSDDMESKRSFVQESLARHRPARILDAGCNTGTFSLLAAETGKGSVVAIDRDPAVVAELWSRASREGLDILPLVVDITRPTPSTGWENDETISFLERAAGSFDAVLMLALVHHLAVTERVPLPRIAALTARLTTRLALVEFVGRGDTMFRRLARGRDDLHADWDREAFEAEFGTHFEIVSSVPTGTERRLYELRKRDGV